jgi:hypothetical protein
MSKAYTPVKINGQTVNFPNVPSHRPGTSRSTLSDTRKSQLVRKQENIRAISEQLKSNKNLDRELAEVRRQEEARQRAAKEQEAIDEAELYAEFAKLENKGCVSGKCTIMGGKYKSRKARKGKGKRKGKSIKKRLTRRTK